MTSLTHSAQPDNIPLIRKLAMPVFIILAMILGLGLSGWAIHDSIVGITTGVWEVNTVAYAIVLITYSISGIVTFIASVAWCIRLIQLRFRRQPVWTDRVLTAWFLAAAIAFGIMNVVHVMSEVMACNAGLVTECHF